MLQVLFPLFQKNITQGYVSEDEAGRRLSMVVSSPDYAKSGTYWSWSNPPESEPYFNVLSEEASVRSSCFPPSWLEGESVVQKRLGVNVLVREACSRHCVVLAAVMMRLVIYVRSVLAGYGQGICSVRRVREARWHEGRGRNFWKLFQHAISCPCLSVLRNKGVQSVGRHSRALVHRCGGCTCPV